MSSSNSPCAACKFLRRKCTQECVFAPYFPPDQPQKFANVHKVFGASNVAKILNELNTAQREDAVNSLAFEADARLKDPVYGCVGLISVLQHRLKQVQTDLHNAKRELASYMGPSMMLPVLNQGFIPQMQNMPSSSVPVLPYNMQPMLGVPGPGSFRDPQHAQIMDPQQQEQQLMLLNYENQQQQPPPPQQQQSVDLVRFSGGVDMAATGQVTGSGFSLMTAPAAMSPPLGLASSYVNNMYQIQPQPQPLQEQDHHLDLQPHPLLIQQDSQPPPPATASEEDRSVAPSC
ncbi:LOB domain-containing protein 10-like [Bidens hawaiensis]|uniref:LOB domain-containing protein 10-like n=1 Tax=Bidens hawaiensis TaxID=980011 RepID=UPI00404B9BFE